MSLVLALKNRDSIVVASDTDAVSDRTIGFGQFMNLPGRSIVLMSGTIEAVRAPMLQTVLPKLRADTSAATLAQLLEAALILEVGPKLGHIPGRIELIVAGIDPVRHIEEPGMYYLDSANGFRLQLPAGDFAAAGATAAATELLSGRNLQLLSTDELLEAAKESLTTTKLRWPQSMAAHQQFGIITPVQIRTFGF